MNFSEDRGYDTRDTLCTNEQERMPFAWVAVRKGRNGAEEIMFVSTHSREDAIRYLNDTVRGGKMEALNWRLLQLFKIRCDGEFDWKNKPFDDVADAFPETSVQICHALDEACASLRKTFESPRLY